MNTSSLKYLQLITKAIQGGTEVTLQDLIMALEINDAIHMLDKIRNVMITIKECGLELVPDINIGNINTNRILKNAVHPIIDFEFVQSEIYKGETVNQEFKTSLLYDYNKAITQPTLPLELLKSDEVTHSCLKTIAAFLTSYGGILYVGLNDDGEYIGIEYDYKLINGGYGNQDQWEIHLRNLVTGRFKDGNTINNYITISYIQINNITLSRIQVNTRSRITYLRGKNGNYGVYHRQGNRTVQVGIDEIEELISIRQNLK